MKTKGMYKERVGIITLGCSKNLVDSEVIAGQLRAGGVEAVHSGMPDNPDAGGQPARKTHFDHTDAGRAVESTDDPNIIIINTCGFIDAAKEESIETILQYANARQEGVIDKLYVTGCLSQRYAKELNSEIPEVDAWFGTVELPALLSRFNVDYRQDLLGERSLAMATHYAYLKISEGCNRSCSFCAIPLMRGGHQSRSIESLVSEAEQLAARGVVELLLIAQELTYYGLDLYKARKLPELLHALSAVKGIRWIRLHYAYPSKFPMEIIDAMGAHENICKYLDMPLQHASDRVLKAMRRQITCSETEALIGRIRSKMPDIVLRTTMLVGFPGETEQDFEELMQFTRRMRFDRLGVFTYSHEDGTGAFDEEDDVPEEVKQNRAARLMELQQEISLEKNLTLVGQTLEVLIDRMEGDYYIGRTAADSPEVDNEVLIKRNGERYLRIGDFTPVLIKEAGEFDLYGDVVLSE